MASKEDSSVSRSQVDWFCFCSWRRWDFIHFFGDLWFLVIFLFFSLLPRFVLLFFVCFVVVSTFQDGHHLWRLDKLQLGCVFFLLFPILYKRLTISAVAPFLLKTWDLKQNKKKNNVLFTFNHRLVNKLNYSLLAELEEEYSSFQVLMDYSLWAFMMNTNWARKKAQVKS